MCSSDVCCQCKNVFRSSRSFFAVRKGGYLPQSTAKTGQKTDQGFKRIHIILRFLDVNWDSRWPRNSPEVSMDSSEVWQSHGRLEESEGCCLEKMLLEQGWSPGASELAKT